MTWEQIRNTEGSLRGDGYKIRVQRDGRVSFSGAFKQVILSGFKHATVHCDKVEKLIGIRLFNKQTDHSSEIRTSGRLSRLRCPALLEEAPWVIGDEEPSVRYEMKQLDDGMYVASIEDRLS